MEKSKITIEFACGVSRAYPKKIDFLRNYLPSVCVARKNYNMNRLAGDVDLSPTNFSHKLAGAKAWTYENEHRLKLALTAKEYLPIIAYDIESTQSRYNEREELVKRLAELDEQDS